MKSKDIEVTVSATNPHDMTCVWRSWIHGKRVASNPLLAYHALIVATAPKGPLLTTKKPTIKVFLLGGRS
jgi:hypothetical protein